MNPKQPTPFRKIFTLLLKHYQHDIGRTHSLTSKRIERDAMKMHVVGLRDLQVDFQAMLALNN